MRFSLEFSAMLLGVSTAGTALSLLWYRATYPDPLDRDTVVFFAKLWYGFGAAGITYLAYF